MMFSVNVYMSLIYRTFKAL